MNVLVIGGTRFMGPRVVEELARAGHDVTVFHRGTGPDNLTVGVRHIHGDRHHLPEHREPLRAAAPDVVLDMMLLTEGDARDLVETFRGVAKRLVAVSSQDVYRAYGRLLGTEPGEPDPTPSAEDSPLRERLYPYRSGEPPAEDDPRRWTYDYDKILVERTVAAAPDLPATVLRLPAVYGPNDGQHRLFPYIKRMDDGRPAIVMSEGQAGWRWSRSFVDNAAAAIALAVQDERAAGRTYNVAEPEAFTEAEWVRRIGDVIGWRGEVVALPAERLPEALAEDADFRHHLVVDTSRIRRELGYTEPVPLEEAIRRTVDWERANPPAIDPAQFNYAAEDEALG